MNHDQVLSFIFNQIKTVIIFIKNYLHFVIDFKLYLKIEKSSISPLDIKSNKMFLGVNTLLATNNYPKYENEIPVNENTIARIIK